MNSLFEKCNSIKIFPNIAIWKTQKINEIHNLFNGCLSSAILPNLEKWNIINDPINITFAFTFGYKIKFVLSPNLKFKEVINILGKKLNISFEKYKNKVSFMYKGSIINIDSIESLNDLDLIDNCLIVMDVSNDLMHAINQFFYQNNTLIFS